MKFAVQRHAELIEGEKRPIYILPTRDSLQMQGCIQTENKRIEKLFHVNPNQRKTRVAIFTLDKVDLKTA